MARDQIDMTRLQSRDELVAWIASGETPKEQFRVGTEHEKTPFTLIDARPKRVADKGMIPTAVNIADSEFDKHVDKLPADKLGPQAAKDLARFDEKKIHRIEGRVVRSDGSVDPGVEKFELEDMVWHDDLPGVGVGPDPLRFPGAIVSNVILTPDRSRAYLMIDVGIAKPVFEKMFTCLTAMQDRLGRP